MKNFHTLSAVLLAFALSPAVADEEKTDTDDAQAAAIEAATGGDNSTSGLTNAARKLLDDVNKRITNIDTKALEALLEKEPMTQLIDVRSPREINLLGGSIDAPRHRNIMRGWLDIQIDGLIPDKNTPIVVYCGINQRSPLAADTLMKLGYTNVKNYKDGFFAWKDAGLPVSQPDQALDSFLYRMPEEVIPGVYSAIGATAPPTYDNSGHNNNLSFVITDDGVLVMNAGESYLIAQSLHDEIKKLTDQHVKYVVMENGQGHAMLGMNYWKEQGAKLIMHEDALHEAQEHQEQIIERTGSRRDKNFRQAMVEPDILIKADQKKLDVSLGSWKMEVIKPGPGHSPGDVMLWLPEKKLLITGDFGFHERLLPVFETTDTAGWIETWPQIEALGATHIIPGHGHPVTDIGILRKNTLDYLVFMREKIGEILDEGGALQDAYKIDQSAYSHLDTYDELVRSNAGMIFRAMEFE